MRVTCHIGHHKTGTTSLQAYLSQNSNKLLRAGILYPWVESRGAAIAMAKANAGRCSELRYSVAGIRDAFRSRKETGDRPGILPINFREAHNALAFRMLADANPAWRVPPYHAELPHSRQMLFALRNQLKQLRPREVILCSEVMSQFGKVRPKLIGKLRKALEAAPQFTVWCTLRRPDQQAVSWHGQQIKFGQNPKPLSHPNGVDFDWLHFDYRGVIEPWLEHIPEAKLVLRPYDAVIRSGGSVEDLVANSGISFPRAMLPAPTMNVSLPPAVTGLMREANSILPRSLARDFGDQIGPIARSISQPSSKEVEYFGPENRARMLEKFTPIHEVLNRLSGMDRFFSDLDDMLVCNPIPEKDAIRQLLDGLDGQERHLKQPELREFLKYQIKHFGSLKNAG